MSERKASELRKLPEVLSECDMPENWAGLAGDLAHHSHFPQEEREAWKGLGSQQPVPCRTGAHWLSPTGERS